MNHETKPDQSTPAKQSTKTSALTYINVLLVGAYLGFLFVKSEVARWDRIHDMFLFREAYMYLIIGTAIVVAMLSMFIIKRLGITTLEGQPIQYKPKPFHSGVVIGGMLFGAGWAITGACPGPIYAQIGAGEWMALCTLVGAMLGMFSYAGLKSKLPH
ncbi:DUF6691 family protein [Aureliella helgolandensis]|uniref:Uncharacterized protein n=1 Tax=Aureliella helgolandensis TaxID=2527968 RepID=A0A518GD47_9BACT|nr:DUF6691 family protein [Aureliella helgolandensis]QDV26487.1 hypothetical protein Q31a_48610 [Aureliella helgolandensis]